MASRIQTRIKLRNDTLSNWSTSSVKIFKGEAALGYDTESNKYEIRIGVDDTTGSTWTELAANNLTVPVANVIGLDSALYDYQLIESSNGVFQLQKKLHSLPDEDPTSHESNWQNAGDPISLSFQDSSTAAGYSSSNKIALKNYVDEKVANSAKVYVGTRATASTTDDAAITTALNGATPVGGNICVIKTLIVDNGWIFSDGNTHTISFDNGNGKWILDEGEEGEDENSSAASTATEVEFDEAEVTATKDLKYSYKAFVYDGTLSAWKAMDGNYDAKNVFLDSNITYTTNVGTLNTITSSKTKDTFNCEGMSVFDALKSILSKTLDPTVTNPSYSLAIGTITTSAGSKSTGNEVEAGTTVTKVAWNGTYTDGTYSYKSAETPNNTAAHCVASYEMSNNVGGTMSSTATEDGTCTLAETFVIEAPTAAGTATKDNTLVTFTGKCSYAASDRTPYNNIQETVPSKMIPASSSPIQKTATATLKGYHNGVYFGGIKSAKYTAAQLKANPGLLRTALSVKNVSGYSTYGANTRNNAGARPNTFKFVADTDTYTIVIAVKGTRTLSSAFNDSVFAEMASSFEADKETGVVIPGAGDDAGTEYTVWTYSPVDRYSSEVKMSITMAG